MCVGYARVSTKDQSLALQVDALQKAQCEKVFQEIASGAKTARPILADLLSRLRPGDVLVIWKLDRLGRSLKHLVTLTNELMARQIGLISEPRRRADHRRVSHCRQRRGGGRHDHQL
jgi:DNA invertase Pin-like site-specific DNA recombinase